MRNARSFAAALALGAVLAAAVRASDEPHWANFTVGCSSCHALHKAAGGNLTSVDGNDNLCASCHNLGGGLASRFPMDSMSPADLLAGTGSSHAWGVSTTNSAAGASPPTSTAMAQRLPGGNVMCSTCHNQHANDPAAIAAGNAGSQFVGPATKKQGSGTGSVAFSYSATASPKAYLVEIVETQGAAGTAKFRISNDGGISWWGWNGSAWVAYAAGNARLTSTTPVALNDGTNATVTFSGTFATTPTADQFGSHVGYAFLRRPLDSGTLASGSRFCRDCHAEWAMDHASVRSWDGNMKQHPTGISLNANGRNYDRVTAGVPKILDGDGAVQPSGADNNPSNDLKLASDDTVQCFTCHGVHHSPGNTAAKFAP